MENIETDKFANLFATLIRNTVNTRDSSELVEVNRPIIDEIVSKTGKCDNCGKEISQDLVAMFYNLQVYLRMFYDHIPDERKTALRAYLKETDPNFG